jgi:hypothetical protein
VNPVPVVVSLFETIVHELSIIWQLCVVVHLAVVRGVQLLRIDVAVLRHLWDFDTKIARGIICCILSLSVVSPIGCEGLTTDLWLLHNFRLTVPLSTGRVKICQMDWRWSAADPCSPAQKIYFQNSCSDLQGEKWRGAASGWADLFVNHASGGT